MLADGAQALVALGLLFGALPLSLLLFRPFQSRRVLLRRLLARRLLSDGIAAGGLLLDGVLSRRFQLLLPRRFKLRLS